MTTPTTRKCIDCGASFRAHDPAHDRCSSCRRWLARSGFSGTQAQPGTIVAWRSEIIDQQRTIPNTQPWRRR